MFDERDRYSADNCSVQRTLDVVGEKWTLLVLRESFYGARRFEQFHERVGCARNLLTERLSTLTAAGVMDRVPYREPGQRERHEYRLTDKGRDLITAVVALMQWGDRWEADSAGPPVEIVHRDCSHPVEAVLVCTRDGETLSAREIRPTPGPGARLVSPRQRRPEPSRVGGDHLADDPRLPQAPCQHADEAARQQDDCQFEEEVDGNRSRACVS